LDGRGIGVRFPAGVKDFSVLHSVQTELWGSQSLLHNGYRGLYLSGVGCEAEHSSICTRRLYGLLRHIKYPSLRFLGPNKLRSPLNYRQMPIRDVFASHEPRSIPRSLSCLGTLLHRDPSYVIVTARAALHWGGSM
jgi:hypothetical protein